MSRIIVDTGPCLNFLSLREGDLLHDVLCPDGSALLIPDVVADELRNKAGEDNRFAPAARVFDGMKRAGKFEELLSDLDNEALLAEVEKISPRPVSTLRTYRAKDVGEIVAIAHAVLLTRQGHDVELLLEDGNGRQWAADAGFPSTITSRRVLALAARDGRRTLPEMRELYARMRPLDNRFPRWDQSGLDNPKLYRERTATSK